MAISQPGNREAHAAVVEAFGGRTVLITGAAGSIGSELARQVLSLPVAHVVLLDRDENSMFELLRSLENAEGPSARPSSRELAMVSPVLGDIRDETFIHQTVREMRPHIVLHAAAYKHVSMMEANPCEAVLNNVTGTSILIEAALASRCERLLLISTDKAVDPSSVMGATKRVAELLMQGTAAGHGLATVLASVRFVNVTGSRGSVVPIFQAQIEAGGPVTVTDQRMTRYFISIGQAAALLLQAATLDQTGAIYALEAGAPVRIVDLARRQIEAAGLVPDKDIAIREIGIRSGEKLHEQLHRACESPIRTPFSGIDLLRSDAVLTLPAGLIDALESAAQRRDTTAVMEILRSLPLGYAPPVEP